MLASNLKHTITHWPVTGSDGYGGFTFGAPTVFIGRWEDRAEQYKDDMNEEHISRAIIYMSGDVNVGDYLANGNYCNIAQPTDTAISHRICQYHRTTDLRNLVSLRKVFL